MGCSIFRFMGSHNLQEWTRIGAMNPFLQRKPKRQRTGAVQDLAEARKHLGLACVLECGSPLPLSDERFIESFNILASRLVSSLAPPQMGKSTEWGARSSGSWEATTSKNGRASVP